MANCVRGFVGIQIPRQFPGNSSQLASTSAVLPTVSGVSPLWLVLPVQSMLPLMLLDARVSENLQHGRITLRVTVTFWSCLQRLRARTERSFQSCSGCTLARSVLHVVTPRSAGCSPRLPGSCRSCSTWLGRHCRVFFTKRTFDSRLVTIWDSACRFGPSCVSLA